ncbi:MAG TPA: DNA polymerase III subunit epsilon [Rhizomicrobium sp.]|jgi:DNA polymerase-3 subunit epsilon|nr:DNA polymerase III subunit epsilon [Rhizomicrobium sp.]
MREIVLDTETTGLDPDSGHRVIEIGCVELVDHFPTGKSFQRYLNPERDMPPDAQRIHGISSEFLSDKPLFSHIAEEFLEFIADAPLVIHNASFDLKFLNAELARVSRKPLSNARAIDTVDIAKSKYPGSRYSLDELCRRFSIDLSGRSLHGALLDAELTAQVYIELTGGRQKKLLLSPADEATVATSVEIRVVRVRPVPLVVLLNDAELGAHAAFVAKELGQDAVWSWG